MFNVTGGPRLRPWKVICSATVCILVYSLMLFSENNVDHFKDHFTMPEIVIKSGITWIDAISGNLVRKGNWWCPEPDLNKIESYRRAEVDPDHYKGWKHPYWTPEKSLNLTDYIDFKQPVVMDFETCSKAKWGMDWKKNISLILMLHSNPNPGGERVRKFNRETWMNELKIHKDVKVLFLIGKPSKENYLEQQRLLEHEQSEHCDMLQFNFKDSYFNATIKTSHAIQFFYRYKWNKVQGPPPYILRGDDDVYFNIPRIKDIIKAIGEESKLPDVCDGSGPRMVGQLIKNKSIESVRTISGTEWDKWLIPPYSFDDAIQDYLNGPGFLIPRWSIPCLAKVIWKLPLQYIDDIYTAGLLAQSCNVVRQGIKEWNGFTDAIFEDTDLFVEAYEKHAIYHLGASTKADEAKVKLYNEFQRLKKQPRAFKRLSEFWYHKKQEWRP